MASAFRTPWQAMAGHPVRFLRSAAPWRSFAYLATGAVVGPACLVAASVLAFCGVALAPALVGLALLAALVLLGVPVAVVERSRLRLVDPGPIGDGHRPPPAPGLTPWLRTRLGERATWRELVYALLLATVLWPLDLIVATGVPVLAGGLIFAAAAALAMPGTDVALLGLTARGPWATVAGLLLAGPVAVAGAYAWTCVAAGHAMIARLLLGAREEELGALVVEVSRSRARLVNAFEAERRRIERDLHDGAQQRLVALTMKLGIARLEMPAGAPAAELVAQAHEDAKQTVAELRELVHGIHPRLLADRGLPAALAELARRSAIPATVDVRLPGRPPAAVEGTVYFAVSEALANAAKHAGASRVLIRVVEETGALTAEVEDDGAGGAAPRDGGGLQGLADRAAVVHGTVEVTSPPGGPTVVRLRVPRDPGDTGGVERPGQA